MQDVSFSGEVDVEIDSGRVSVLPFPPVSPHRSRPITNEEQKPLLALSLSLSLTLTLTHSFTLVRISLGALALLRYSCYS